MVKSNKTERVLDERESAVLKALVYEFIVTGKPVGSRSFVQKYSFSISPATMRNIMFDLENLGFLMQPHTSSGRIPTDVGYRFYVDSLLDTYEFVMSEKVRVREELIKKELQLDKMFASVSKMLSLVSKYASVVLSPKPDFTVVKHVELIPLDSDEILFILVTRNGMILNKKVSVSTRITQDDIYELSRYLTGELCGYSLYEIKKDIFDRMRVQTNHDYKKGLALDIAQLALTEETDSEIFIDGIENLLRIPEMIEADKLKSLLHLIEEKRLLKSIIERNIDKDGVNTLIGEEVSDLEISGCSIITSSYQIGKSKVGVVGIIGPTRMDYEKVVPLVDYTGKVVTDLLTKMSK
ncbi:MAG TPA: heat-inducible transcriptional repressor HrcA [Spirochaetota bacterium]|nr:heat-inducible transcriptional repressor HrcA [Spirochaetota bacterium]HNT12610.1 heat-inducible transcriptional repressor HrcA [Spirochaetota bacterium]HNV48837.1 heat-inducible transcriptional repressor HrcA [Spirochaetota bacterium]HOS39178.1 heat-inducible transcriptional repressor HrcA [Spirochaetota bacterium]HPI23445.1 heat-inducible transcriptional repressor HrcA [Spirochaetota bacterium]